jgi:predicted lipoprotein with Yx(FWY)xxD motif
MKNTTLFLLMLVVISTLLIAGCTMPKSTLPASTAQPTPQTTQLPAPMPVTQLPDTIKKADTAFGAVLVDGQGKTLYYFTIDQYTNGASACDDACVVVWPVF